MARKRKLRSYRGKMNLDNMIKAGNSRYKGIVYGYQFPSRRDIMKIGYSSRGLVRISEQSTGFPETPDVLFSIHHKHAADLEKEIHQSLAAFQVKDVMGTEWFGVTLDQVVSVSPDLRKALGRQRWRSVWRWIAFVCLFMISLLALPPLEVIRIVTTGQLSTAEAWEWIRSYGAVVVSFEPGSLSYLFSAVTTMITQAGWVTLGSVAALVGFSWWITFQWR